MNYLKPSRSRQKGARKAAAVSRRKPRLAAVVDLASLPLLDVVQAEQKISSLLERLQASPAYCRIQDKELGDFWEPDWPQAPFEQSMRLKGISALGAQNLLRKRSFSGRKVLAFIAALGKALLCERPRRAKPRRVQKKGRRADTRTRNKG